MKINSPGYATKFDKLSLASCYVELKGPGAAKPHATGFFWRHGQSIYLVTNWHVVTGKNIFTGKFLQEGWCAEAVVVRYASAEAPTLAIASTPGVPNQQFGIKEIELPLYHDYNEPLWVQHKEIFDWNIDIAILPLAAQQIDAVNVVCVNDYKFERLLHFVGADILVIGHPLPSNRGNYPITFPIWKRGSIASEPLVPWNMRPAFLADVRTSKGMSGSPVIRRVYGPATKADLTMAGDNVVCSEFMGIYSGRLHDDENNASIGLVWYRNLIDEIISKPATGSRDWRESTVPSFQRLADGDEVTAPPLASTR